MVQRYKTLNCIELDRNRMLGNLALFEREHPNISLIPVLKGNAYGHGIAAVAEILRDAKCQYVAVDGYFEATKVRDITHQHILVMGHILPENVRLLDTKRCSFVVQDVAGLHAFGALHKRVRVHLELNTGMNRLGLEPSELDEYLGVLKRYPKLELEGVMTHLADADNDTSNEFNEYQQRIFDENVAKIIEAGFRPKIFSIAQTAGSKKIVSKYANAIRVGIGLYGINPLAPSDARHRDLIGLQPVLELKSTIIKVLNLKAGDRVSYSGTFVAPRDMRAAVLPIGYYEGVPRELSNKGCVTHGEIVLPILGRVCMNHVVIDLAGTNLQVNDQVTVISKDPAKPNSIAGLKKAHHLFEYATLTGLSSSIRRVIV